MNKGISHAKGEWILFLNAGDVFAETNVLTKVLPFTKNKEQDILYGDIFTLAEVMKELSKKH